MDRVEPVFEPHPHAGHGGYADPAFDGPYGHAHAAPGYDQQPQYAHAVPAHGYQPAQYAHDGNDYAYEADYAYDDDRAPVYRERRSWISRVPLIAIALVMAVWAPVTINAMWLQDSPHPAPFFATPEGTQDLAKPAADATAQPAPATVTPEPAARSTQPQTVEPVADLIREVTAAPAAAPQPTPAVSAEQASLAEIQQVWAEVQPQAPR